MVTHTKSSILLEWKSWNGYLEQPPAMHLEYHIEYQLSRGDTFWKLAAMAEHQNDRAEQLYNIQDLEVNTHYSFRIRPKIVWRGTYYDGDYSREGSGYKTKCDGRLTQLY